MQREAVENRFRVIQVIAWIYFLLGFTFFAMGLANVQFAGQRLDSASAIVPGLLAVGAVGTLLKKQWGRYLSYFFSIILLVAIPIGTLLGAFMLYHLTHSKDLFAGGQEG
jgi:hypothetical protein